MAQHHDPASTSQASARDASGHCWASPASVGVPLRNSTHTCSLVIAFASREIVEAL